MKRLWIAPLILIFLLILAWFFRWEEGPTQVHTYSNGKSTITYYHDRWTGTNWAKLYGYGHEYAYSMWTSIEALDLAKKNKGKDLVSAALKQDKRKCDLATTTWAGLVGFCGLLAWGLYRREKSQNEAPLD